MSRNFRLYNRQRRVRLDLALLRRVVAAAWEDCVQSRPHPQAPSATEFVFPPVEATLLSDAAIAQVHADFFNDPSPTDVITFPYGEILLGAETIAAQAAEHGHSVEREAALCLIHGLLHLRGFDDQAKKDRARMHRCQEKILQKVFPLAP